MSESSCLGNYTGSFRFDVGDGGDWVRHCHRLACTGELLLCSAAKRLLVRYGSGFETIWRLWSVCWVRRSHWRASHWTAFLSICLTQLLVLEQSKCELRRVASVFLFLLVGSFFALSCWHKPSKVILDTSCEVSCCSLDILVFVDCGIAELIMSPQYCQGTRVLRDSRVWKCLFFLLFMFWSLTTKSWQCDCNISRWALIFGMEISMAKV